MSAIGILYMLTATEIQHLKSVINTLLEIKTLGDIPYTDEEALQALEILDKLKPLDIETIETIVSEGKE